MALNIMINQQGNYTNQILEKVKKIKLHLSFKIWGADLVDMQLISKYDRGIKFLLQVTNIFSKYAWVVPLKDKKGITIANASKKLLHESGRKPNIIWVNESSEFHNRSRKSWKENNGIEMYSTQKFIAERFIRTLKTKICKYMTSVSRKVYINKLNKIVNKYNNSYYRTIKGKPVDVKNHIYIYIYIYIY